MKTDAETEFSDKQNKIAAELVRLAGIWVLYTCAMWRDREPSNYATFKRLLGTGEAATKVSITIRVGASHEIDIVGIVDGEEHPIAFQDVRRQDDVEVTH